MTDHNIFFGGQRTRNPDWAMLPSVEPCADDCIGPDARGAPVFFSLHRRLSWAESCETCGACIEPVGGPAGSACGCMCPSSSRKVECNSKALKQYLQCNPVAIGDVLNTVIMPKGTELFRLLWKVTSPITPFTFDLRVRGNAASMGGTEAAPVPFTLAAGIDGTTVGMGYIDVAAVYGQPMFFDQNDMLQIVVNDLPASSTPDCSACGTGGIAGSVIELCPVVLFPCRCC